MKKPVLVIMAAGIGSRYGAGVKQLAKVGPSGEIIMDYSLYDAREAGFEKVVFVIRRDLEKDFREAVGDRIARVMQVAYAYQEKEDLPEGYVCPAERGKPWGTGHAVLAARQAADGPIAVINADDYYGREAFRLVYDYLVRHPEAEDGRENFVMAGFALKNTLSDSGSVSRGVCVASEDGTLTEIRETKNIMRGADGTVRGEFDGRVTELDENGLVSMNMWGFSPALMKELEAQFPAFLDKALAGDPLKAEYMLPAVVDGMLKEGRARVTILKTDDSWFGITYQADKESVQEEFRKMLREGRYPSPLFP